MKIMKKRLIALLIDGFILGAFYELCRLILLDAFWEFGILCYIIVFSPFIFKDCIFRGSSIGKKIVGLRVFTTKWEQPSIWLLAKRTLYMSTIGYALWWRIKLRGESMMCLFDWEQRVLGTTVIDKNVFRELKEKAQDEDGDFSNNLLNLYNNYLREHY